MICDVLIVDDDAAVRDALAQTVELNELVPRPTGSFIEAKDYISPRFPGVILSDIRMPGRDGFHLLNYTQGIDAELPVVLLTAEGDIPMAVKAMGQGAFDFLEKPCAPDALLSVLQRALQTRRLVLENRHLKAQLEQGDPASRLLFGISQKAQDLRAHVRRVAGTQTEVLVTGPPGAGISKVAEVVHLMSPAASGPFIKCAGASLSPDDLKEALFAGQGGALFIDEVIALPQPTQYALLEHLDGTGKTRLIAGTTADLCREAERGAFHSELYYRLDVAPVRIPSLSDRPEDIPVLFDHYVAQAAEQSGLAAPQISSDHQARLMAQDWPGNARSLMSAAMRYVLGMPEEATEAAGLGLAQQMARVERSLLIAALGRQNGRASEAAKDLKLPRKTFYDKLSRYGVKPEDYRRS